MRKLSILISLLGILFLISCKKNNMPEPFGALPSKRQMEWHKMNYYAFVHFNINTFSNLEWGHGNEEPSIFNPSELDCRQWAKVCKEAGMEGIIITAKHHDGFCLWPSKYTDHSVKNSPWRNGKGDLLKELSEACKEFGLKMGVYLSPWDRNNPLYGTKKYNDYFIKQLTEVLTGYGDIFEVWFDGANGEGPNGKKQVYDWDRFISTVRKYQPNAVIFSDAGPDIRWVGNERGYAKETNWNTLNRDNYYPGTPNYHELTEGNINGTHWLPAEVNVSIRPGWYYHKDQDDDVKSVDFLEMIYYNSVGRGSNLLLNLPVDRRGLVHENEIEKLQGLKQRLDDTFSKPVPIKIPVSLAFTTSYLNVGEPTKYLLDDDLNTFWSSREDVTKASFEIELEKGQKVNILEIAEYIPLGQRVETFEVEALIKGRWEVVFNGKTIGWKRLIRLPDIDCQRYRINITKTMASPVISNIKMYYNPYKNYLLESRYDYIKRMDWWRDAKFGMFLKSETFLQSFSKLKNFEADEWVSTAKSAGMKYLVVTAKNSDGFCMWNSKYTTFDIFDTSQRKRDVLREIMETCKKQDLKFGIRYAIKDSHHPDAKAIQNSNTEINPNFQKYVETYLKPQVKELIEKYSPDIFWLDEERIPEWTHENGLDLYQFIRDLKPTIIINDRVDKGRIAKLSNPKDEQPFAGDFETLEENKFEQNSNPINWEYLQLIKSNSLIPSQTIVKNLIDITTKGGNLLLGIHPNRNNFSQQKIKDHLMEIGEWLAINGEGIYEKQPYSSGVESDSVVFTFKQIKAKKYIYAIFSKPFSNDIVFENITPMKDSKIYLLGHETPLDWEMNSEGKLIIKTPEILLDETKLPCKNAWVLKILEQPF